MNERLIDEKRKELETLGITVIDSVRVYDDISLFGWTKNLLEGIAKALGNTPPTHKEIMDVVNKTKDNPDFKYPGK